MAARATSSANPEIFAALPDRGELLDYDRRHALQERGAYTSHPVALSEEHAMRASFAGGELTLRAPNGQLLRIAYDRHVEHADGNWTWVGRASNGADAVLTFGERAVFGTIPYGDQEPLRVTTRAGRAWLVATDRDKLPAGGPASRGDEQPDYLVPPSLAAAASGLADPAATASADTVQSSNTKAVTTVDLVLGFTVGYATQYGGASQAITRLTNLTQIANQALVNSLVEPRIRLVRAVQVDYPDDTDNAVALEELSGYRAGAEIPVPAGLQPLRTARDEFGGDLVSLVRAFRTPQNNGCGIAWLIGGGQSAYTTARASFAYSIVSDGTDIDERDNLTYLCRDETLGHELGHNLGQQHNTEDGTVSGVHPYSYGYRETATDGFYTVMAYRLPGSRQTAILHFANPDVSFANRLTGVANVADNARSLRLTMPIAAEFRPTVVFDDQLELFRGGIRGVGSKCLDAVGGGTTLGTGIQVWACSGVRQQRWSIVNPVAGIGSIQTDKLLDIVGFGTGNGTPLQLWTSTGASNQAWYFTNIEIVANGNRVLDAIGMASDNGTRIQLWDGNGGAHQTWIFNPLNGRITGKDGKCLDVTGSGTANGTPVQLWSCSGGDNQNWRVGNDGSIIGLGGKCLEAANNGTANGTGVQMWDCDGGLNQVWRLRGEIRSLYTNQCLDDPAAGQTNGSRVHMWMCHGGLNQEWEIYPY